jgi:hypothetical protein
MNPKENVQKCQKKKLFQKNPELIRILSWNSMKKFKANVSKYATAFVVKEKQCDCCVFGRFSGGMYKSMLFWPKMLPLHRIVMGK